MIGADIRHELERMVIAAEHFADEELVTAFAELEEAALGQIESEHVGYEAIEFRRLAELRYAGQHHPLAVDVGALDRHSVEVVTKLQTAFHEKHQRLYGFRREDSPVELLRIQVAAIGKVQRADGFHGVPRGGSASKPRERRRLFLDGAFNDAPVYHRDQLGAGSNLLGPCVIEEATSTTYLAPDFALHLDAGGNLRIAVPRRERAT
jgi:N-methylhydantoinase A